MGRTQAGLKALGLLCTVLAASTALAQQKVPFSANGFSPVAPTGLEDQPLGAGPFHYKTGEGMDITVEVLARDLPNPYSIVFLPDGEALVSHRDGSLRRLKGGAVELVEGGPRALHAGKSGTAGAVHGYMNLALHPRFAQNRWVYLSYTKPMDGGRNAVAVARGRYEGGRLQDVKDIFVSTEARGALPIYLDRDAMLWLATAGYTYDEAQDPKVIGGKVLRLKDDGSVPTDNPFAGKAGHRPEIFSMGHRSVLGFVQHKASGALYISEMGPNGGDEVNRLEAGANYGWPIVSLGRTYPGPWQHKGNIPTHEGFVPPVVYWTPAISVSGLSFYNGDALPKWKGDLFVGGLRTGEIPGTGRLDRVLLNENMEELRRETLLADLHQRIRDVQPGPDGLLYVLTDEARGAILRIRPAR